MEPITIAAKAQDSTPTRDGVKVSRMFSRIGFLALAACNCPVPRFSLRILRKVVHLALNMVNETVICTVGRSDLSMFCGSGHIGAKVTGRAAQVK